MAIINEAIAVTLVRLGIVGLTLITSPRIGDVKVSKDGAMPELTVAILASTFRSAFRREVGTTPSTYRKSSGTSQVDEA